MPFPLLIPLISAAASAIGGALSNKSKQTSTTTPTLDPAYGPLQKMVLDQITQRLSGGSSLPAGYATTGIKNVNNVYDLVRQSQENNLTSRGLGLSPIAGAVDAKREIARGGGIIDFQNTLPLLERELRNQDLGMAGSVLNFGRGSSTTGTTESGGGAAGAFTNLAQMLGYLTGQGVFGGQNPLASRNTASPFGFMPSGGVSGRLPS